MLRRRSILVLATLIAVLIPTPAHAADTDPEKDMNATANREQHDAEVNAAVNYVAYFFGVYLDGSVAAERAAAQRAEAATVASRQHQRPAASAAPSSGACGGDLPPCYVLQRESHGDPNAENPVSTASGLWQFIDGTWDNYGGYSHASDAPPEVQNERARQVWNGGAGCSNWSAC